MLTVKNIRKTYGDILAVDDVSFSVRAGETVAIMGPSGCGKSTTIRMINKLVIPDSGSVLVDGRDVLTLSPSELRQMRKRIGFVFQSFQLIGRLTARENVMLGLVTDGMAKEEASVLADEMLAKVGMQAHRDALPRELSGGGQQRVAIARALAFRPPVILWDEPTASLDPILVREVLLIMEELAEDRAAAMVVVTHELPFALHVADRILLMDKGRIVEEGAPETVFRHPRSEVGRRYRDLIEYQTDQTSRSL
ncbi:MAG: amino acid ABC transporter ATP-binding protein [Selenomonadales bacterium]|nr:amino acid ABC transporter ATP-binding protein [Selenomonadales bacterium]